MALDFRLLSLTALTILMWGFWGFFGKLALERRMSPLTVFLAEILMSVVLAVPLLVILLRRGQEGGGQEAYVSWNVFGLLSGAGLALGLLFYYFALEKGEASVIVPVTSVYPVVSVLLSYFALGERLRFAQWAGVALVVLGLVLLLSGPVGGAAEE